MNIDAMQRQIESYERTINKLMAIINQQWIPVTDRLPDDDGMKLVTCQTKKGIKSVNRAYYMNGEWHGSGSMSGVTAWMELPEPYEAKEK